VGVDREDDLVGQLAILGGPDYVEGRMKVVDIGQVLYYRGEAAGYGTPGVARR